MPEMSTADSTPGRVFLCHSSGDKIQVRNLYQRLRDDGFSPWLDQEDLLPGQEWSQEIPKAVRLSVVVLVCLSQKSVTKTGYVQKEIKYALDVADEQPEGGIFLIPVRLENCDVPERLRRWQWVDLFEKRGYDKLVKALRTRLPTESDSKNKLKVWGTDLSSSLPKGQLWRGLAALANLWIVSWAGFLVWPHIKSTVTRGPEITGAAGKYVRIRADTFLMGCSVGDAECYQDERPTHKVALTRLLHGGDRGNGASVPSVCARNETQHASDPSPSLC
jgi:hypothetical protein